MLPVLFLGSKEGFAVVDPTAAEGSPGRRQGGRTGSKTCDLDTSSTADAVPLPPPGKA